MTSKPSLEIGKQYVAEIGNIAHGGHFVTHVQGCIVFVRGALTGERAKVLITHTRKKVYFGVAREILESSESRVGPSCAASTSCGGCDFQFIDPSRQRDLKTTVLKDSLQRFTQLNSAHVEQIVGAGVRPLGEVSGLGWRGRARFVWNGAWQMHQYRSDAMVDTPACTTITAGIGRELIRLEQIGGLTPGEYTFAEGLKGVSVLGPTGHVGGPDTVSRHFTGSDWESSPQDFWQSNAALLPVVHEMIRGSGAVQLGTTWWDLYAGSGVFSHVLAQGVGTTGSVTSVEGNRTASQNARERFNGLADSHCANIRVVHSSVESFVSHMRELGAAPDGIFLDPPRSGAGVSMCEVLLELSPSWILYLACDPVALARDARVLCAGGHYELHSVNAWDAFPMTHHFESLAVFQNTKVS